MSHQHATKANIINQQGFHYTDRTNSQHASALISCLANLSSQCNISMHYNIHYFNDDPLLCLSMVKPQHISMMTTRRSLPLPFIPSFIQHMTRM